MDVDLTNASFQSGENKTSEIETTTAGNADNGNTFDFTERTWREDFAFIVENKKLYVTKAILALVSPVFDKMFQSDFKEKDMTELELPGKLFDDVQDFLRLIYPGTTSAVVSKKNVYRVLPLAEEYQVSCLKSKCEQFLISSLNGLSIDEQYDMCGQASTYNLEDLQGKCIAEVSRKPIEKLDNALKRMSLPLKIVCEIQDKMVRRLEQSEWYEGAYKYLLHGFNEVEKREIQNFEGWTGRSLQFPLIVAELQKRENHSNTFTLFDIEVTCAVVRSVPSGGNLTLYFSADKIKLKNVHIPIRGRLVIRCGTHISEDCTCTFKTELRDDRSSIQVHLNWKGNSADRLFEKTAGFIHNGKMDAEIHLLADRKFIQ